MKKNILLTFMFITLFFIGNNDVLAELKCEVGGKGCSDIEEATDSINKYINTEYDMARLACLYEVELNTGKKYYNYIFYHSGSDKIYGGTTLGSFDGVQVLQSNDNAWLLGSAYENLYTNNQCPENSYIDTDGFNEICFDDGNGECVNNKGKYGQTDFSITKSSNNVLDNADAIKYKNLNWNNACSNKDNFPKEFNTNTSNVCRYKSTSGEEYALLLYNGVSSQLIHNSMTGTKTIINGNSTITNTRKEVDQGMYYYNSIYENRISNTINSCPTYLYYNYNGFETQGMTTNYNYTWGLEKESDAQTTRRFQYVSCSNTGVSIEESIYESCGDLLIDTGLQEIINNIMTIIRIAVPIMLIGLVTYDFIMAVLAGADDKVSKVRTRAIKRVVIAIIIFFVPTFINLVFNMVNEVWGTNFETCGIAQNTE